MAAGLGGARSGSPCSVRSAEVQQSEPYRSLSDLLRYEEHPATVSLKCASALTAAFRRRAQAVQRTRKILRLFADEALAGAHRAILRGYKFGEGEIICASHRRRVRGIEDNSSTRPAARRHHSISVPGFRDMARAAGLAVCLPEFVGPTETRELSALSIAPRAWR
jgi:hypothetical protein